MKRMWKNFRINLMYWRFRNVTSRRLRLQSWYRRRQPTLGYRPRGSAVYVYRHSTRQTWIVLLVMVALLTAVRVLGSQNALAPTLTYGLSGLVIIAALYWAMRGV